MKTKLILFFISTCSILSAQDLLEFTDLYGDYLGQPISGDTPTVFARGIVSTDDLEHSAPAFSPEGNEVYWWVNRPPKSENDECSSWGMYMQRINNRWTAPVVSDRFYGTPVFSADGSKAFYSASLQNNGTAQNDPMEKDIWMVEKEGDKWSEPKCLNFVKSYPEIRWAGFPTMISVADNGNLYFMGYLQGAMNDFGIYRSEFIDGKFMKPELLPRNINLVPYLNWTPCISPDEDYLLFSSNRIDRRGGGDLFVSFHMPNGRWSDPVSLGNAINTPAQERLPGLSPDGKFLFFTRWTPDHDQDVFWVSSKIIDVLRAQCYK